MGTPPTSISMPRRTIRRGCRLGVTNESDCRFEKGSSSSSTAEDAVLVVVELLLIAESVGSER